LNDSSVGAVVSGVIGSMLTVREQGVDEARAQLAGSERTRGDDFAILLDRSLDRQFRLARVILGNREDAEDAVEDAALRAWQHFRELRDHARFDAWLCRIVVNACRDRMHDRQRRRTSVLDAEPAGPCDEYAASDERAALRQALARLTPEHRAVVALHYLEGLTIDEIADHVGARPGTVKSRLHYGLAELRAAYDAAARTAEEWIR
jgi:RNA polymerase sigma-70 factor (ECF subfamily)